MYTEREFEGSKEDIEFALIEHMKRNGFFVVAEVDVQKILIKNFEKDIGYYRILEVCKPIAAKELIEIDERIGLYLPCKILLSSSGTKLKARLLLIEDMASAAFPNIKEKIYFYQKEIESVFSTFTY